MRAVLYTARWCPAHGMVGAQPAWSHDTGLHPTCLRGTQVGRRGKSRDAAIQHRKKTLLVEMQNRNKSSAFLDKRFGEYDEVLCS